MSGTSIPPIVYTGMAAQQDGFKVVAELDTSLTTGVITFNGRNGTVVLNSSDVNAALGFTPVGANSPALTGTPTAPTASTGTYSTQIATTAFVQDSIAAISTGVYSFNSRTGAVTLQSSDVTAALTYTPANLVSPPLTGTPTAPTAATGTNSTQIATTAFVQTAVSSTIAGVSSFNSRTGAVTLLGADVVGALTYIPASLNSPTFVGTPTAPTPATGDNSNLIATTAFVATASVSSFNSRVGAVTMQGSDIASATTAGGVGSYTWATPISQSSDLTLGATVIGSHLVIFGSTTLSGTWRCMAYSSYDAGTGTSSPSLFQRIS